MFLKYAFFSFLNSLSFTITYIGHLLSDNDRSLLLRTIIVVGAIRKRIVNSFDSGIPGRLKKSLKELKRLIFVRLQQVDGSSDNIFCFFILNGVRCAQNYK